MSKREVLVWVAAGCFFVANSIGWTMFQFERMAHQNDSCRDSVTIKKLSAHASRGLQLETERARIQAMESQAGK